MDCFLGNVIIFKGDDDSKGSSDPYVIELNSLSLNTQLIPALKFEFHHLNELKDLLSKPENYAGIIFSSPRCVQAVQSCTSNLSNWKDKKMFVVGTKTANLVRKLCLEPLGEDCGNSSSLTELIVKDYHLKMPLLMPHGNLSQLDNFKEPLSKHGMQTEELEVYQTIPNPQLDSLINEYFQNHNTVNFIVFMSPSAVNACLPLLKKYSNISDVKFIALGPTTSACLKSHDIAPSAVAEKPTPQHLASALSQIITN